MSGNPGQTLALVFDLLHQKLLVAVHKIKETLTFKRQASVGTCIFKLSKVLMYDFHYNSLKINMETEPSYYLRTLTRCIMKLKPKMHIKTYGMIKIDSTTVIIQKIVNILTKQTKKLSANSKIFFLFIFYFYFLLL